MDDYPGDQETVVCQCKIKKKNIKKKQPKNTYVNVNEIVHTINKSLNYDWT